MLGASLKCLKVELKANQSYFKQLARLYVRPFETRLASVVQEWRIVLSTGLLRRCKQWEPRRLYSRSRSSSWLRPSQLLSHSRGAWLAQGLPLKLLERFRLRRSPSLRPALRGLTRRQRRQQCLPRFNPRVASARPCPRFHLQLLPPFLLLQTLLLVRSFGFTRPKQNRDLSLTYDLGFLRGLVGFGFLGGLVFLTLQIASLASQEGFSLTQIDHRATSDQVGSCDPTMLWWEAVSAWPTVQESAWPLFWLLSWSQFS